MSRQSLTFIPLVCLALSAACDDDGVLEPPTATVTITPATAALFPLAPYDTVQLSIQAYDQDGQPIPDPEVHFLSSVPEIAQVSGSGLVSAVAPGTAAITATLMRSAVAWTSTTIPVTVGWTAVEGDYDLTATVETFDPTWGDLTGYRYTAVLSFMQDRRYATGIGGTFSDLRITGPEGGDDPGESGEITSYFDRDGRPVVELGNYFTITFFGELVAPLLKGTFGAGSDIGGSVRAQRQRSSHPDDGVYDLTVTIVGEDGWDPPLPHYRVTGTLTLQHDPRYEPGIVGMLSDARVMNPDGELDDRVFNGFITSYSMGDDARTPVIEVEAGELYLQLIPASGLWAQQIEGSSWVGLTTDETWGMGIGPFTAVRRPDG